MRTVRPATFALLLVACSDNSGVPGPSSGLAPPARYVVEHDDFAFGLAVSDFTSDGYPDIAVSSALGLTIFPGEGGGKFSSGQTQQPTSLSPTGKFIVGKLLTGGGIQIADSSGVVYSKSGGDGNWLPSYDAGARPLLASDLDGDGYSDLVLADDVHSNVTVSFGSGTGALTPPATLLSVPKGIRANALNADVNGDGISDIIVSSKGFFVVIGSGSRSFDAPLAFDETAIYDTMFAGDLNRDGAIDLVGLVRDTQTLKVSPGNGSGRFSRALSLGLPPKPIDLCLADIDGDSLLDAVTVHEVPPSVDVWLGTGDGAFRKPIAFAADTVGFFSVVLAADLNGDGRADVVTNTGTPAGVDVFVSGNNWAH